MTGHLVFAWMVLDLTKPGLIARLGRALRKGTLTLR